MYPTNIIKRNGAIEMFDPNKIISAIAKAGIATGEFEEDVAKEIAHQLVLPALTKMSTNCIEIEAVQDAVEKALFDTGYQATNKAYILYRAERARTRANKKAIIDVESSMNEYLDQSDWRVKANANQGYSLGGMILNVSGKVTANYWLSSIYPEEVGLAHRNGDYHIHDLDMLSGYCCGHSLRALLNEGFNGVPNKVESNPPKHLSTACAQMVNFLGTLQNEFAGAQAFSSFDTYLAPYIKVDSLSYKEVKQCIQEFIYSLNVPSRWGCVRMDTTVLTLGGWKSYSELKFGDKVFSITDKQELCISNVNFKIKKHYVGELVTFTNERFGYKQTVTGDHRVIYKPTESGVEYKKAIEFLDMADAEIKVPFGAEFSADEGVSKSEYYGVQQMVQGEHFEHSNVIPVESVIAEKFEGDVWCPSVTYGNVIFKDANGHVFMSGNCQSPFTNLTFDLVCPDDLRDQHPLIGGEEVDFTYGELQEEMDMINRAYIEVMTGGDAHGRIFTFPIPTYNITDDFDWDSPTSSMLFEMTAKYGLPYFQNFLNSDLDPHMIRSMCPLDAKTEVEIRLESGKIVKKQIGKITETNFEVPYKGNWYKAKLVRATAQKTRKVLIANHGEIVFGEHHLQPIYASEGGYRTIEIKDLIVGDLIPTNSLAGWHKVLEIKEGKISDNLYCFEVENEEHLFELANGVVTHNCRLRLDVSELLKRGNGLFGSAEQTGSIGVVTLNCARIGYVFKGDKEGLFKRLDYLCDLAKTSLELKRKTIDRFMKEGLYPFTRRYLGSWRNFFSTIGVNGINEMIRNFTNDEHDITTHDGHEFAVEVLEHLNKRIQSYQVETGNLYNLEASPAEGACHRFAREDKKRFPEILQAGDCAHPYYTNSSQLPAGYTDDPFEALEMQEDLQREYTGGTVLHLYMGERISSAETCKLIVKRALSNFRLPYITITPTFSICPKHGYIAGEHKFCPKCDDELVARKKAELKNKSN